MSIDKGSVAEYFDLKDVRQLLATKSRNLSLEEMERAYITIFGHNAVTPGNSADGYEPFSTDAVQAVLGKDMQRTISYLVLSQGLLKAGDRPHSAFYDLPQHLWSTARMAKDMGLKHPIRKLAVMHSLPEYKGRGIVQAADVIQKLRMQYGSEIGDLLDETAEWDQILLDHFKYNTNADGNNSNLLKMPWVERQLKALGNGHSVNADRVINEYAKVRKMDAQSNSRLVPLPAEPTVQDLLFPEIGARLHEGYAEGLGAADTARMNIEDVPYDNGLLIVKALCQINKLQTAVQAQEIERATRESADFMPRLNHAVGFLRNSELVNNHLALATYALNEELEAKVHPTRIIKDNRIGNIAAITEKTMVPDGSRAGENLLEARLLTPVRGFDAQTERAQQQTYET